MALKTSIIEFQALTETDLPMLCEWLNRPHLQKWWRAEKMTLNSVREKYLPRINKEENVWPFIVHSNKLPIGYIQYYYASIGDPNWWPDEPGSGIIGIDQFLANENRLNQGLGTALVTQFVEFLTKSLKVTEIRVDPHPENTRAIRCYEKAGFRKIAPIKTPDGPAIMMSMLFE